jgi:hypothetical protein
VPACKTSDDKHQRQFKVGDSVSLSAKHAAPVLDVAQDGPHNQVNSSTAIEAKPIK